MKTFSFEQRVVHHLILQSPFINDLGLFHGKMGIALFFFEYGRYADCDVYTDIAEELLDDIWALIHTELSFRFASGLSGIGWGIEYLLQNRFISGDGNEICEEIDRIIMQMDLCRLDDLCLDTGLEGLFYYVSARMQGAASQKNPLPFDRQYREDLQHVNSFFDMDDLDAFYNRYPVSVSPFLNSALLTEETYVSASLGLKDGLAGFLLKQQMQRS
ncbi:lanthionine synthetase LanC family protein [Parabacteroides sp. ASD2025]|uniref:lanthionine synthetase LanC family protein n=1 Tax=Parabacteroides sp. ASD2025 TaxID=3415987 RepID=UPI003CE9612E